MIKIKETIIVEGKHDKIKLKSVVEANIIATDGFRIYKNKEKQALIRNAAKKTGIIIITDSDTAGRKIRNFIKNCVKSGEGGEASKENENENESESESENKNSLNINILNIYIPRILGKEKRKTKASKENLIGVEGTDKQKLLEVFGKFGIKPETQKIPETPEISEISKKTEKTEKSKKSKKITKADLYEDKLAGHENSSEKRKYLCDRLDIPYMSAKALVEAVNILVDYNEYKKIAGEINSLDNL